MEVIFDSLAKLELEDTSDYYEFEVAGLGISFIEQDYIYILAIAHCHRQPDYWIDRKL